VTGPTPGPWRRSKNGFQVLTGDSFHTICRLEPLEIQRMDEQLANARLIAASPTMYEYVSKRAERGDEEARRILEEI
jgi:hypothetical protein